MATTPPQRIYPFLYVDDVRAYLTFLSSAFGFTTLHHHVDPEDSEHEHAEATLGGAVVMISHAAPKWGTISPRKLTSRPAAVYLYVDNVDAHFRRARAAGAEVDGEPQDKSWGDRMYTAHDLEGHDWYFATRRASS